MGFRFNIFYCIKKTKGSDTSYNNINNGRVLIHKIPWKVLKIWSQNWYMQFTKWVYEDLWVQEVNVIFRPLNQDSYFDKFKHPLSH